MPEYMDIRAPRGTKVVFHANGGYELERKAAKEVLIVGKVYTVERTEVSNWYTMVYLKEVPDKPFNSVFFAEAVDGLGVQQAVVNEVLAERQRQDAKWGIQDHEPSVWLSILGEEFGELSQAINETIFDNGPKERLKGGLDNICKEAKQVAAVAMALVENIERRRLIAALEDGDAQ